MNTSLLSTILVLWGVTNYISSNKIEHYDPPSVQKSRSTNGYASASYSKPNIVNHSSQPNINDYKNVMERYTSSDNNSQLTVVAANIAKAPPGPMSPGDIQKFDDNVANDMGNIDGGRGPTIPVGGQDRTKYYADMVKLLKQLLEYALANNKEWLPPLAGGQTRPPSATLTPTQMDQVIMKYQALITNYTQLSTQPPGTTASPPDFGRIITTGTEPVAAIDAMFNIADSNWRNDEVLNAAHDSYYKMMTGSLSQICNESGQREQRVSTMTRTNLLSLYGEADSIPDHIKFWKQDGMLTYVWASQSDLDNNNLKNRLGLDLDAVRYLIGIGDVVVGGPGNEQYIFKGKGSTNVVNLLSGVSSASNCENYLPSNLSH